MEERAGDSGQAKLVRQLKARLEDAEQERGSLVRQRRNLELELLDTQEQLEQSEQARRAADRECGAAGQENLLLSSQLRENEQEVENILAKYKTSISALTLHRDSLQNQENTIATLDKETFKYLVIHQLSTFKYLGIHIRFIHPFFTVRKNKYFSKYCFYPYCCSCLHFNVNVRLF